MIAKLHGPSASRRIAQLGGVVFLLVFLCLAPAFCFAALVSVDSEVDSQPGFSGGASGNSPRTIDATAWRAASATAHVASLRERSVADDQQLLATRMTASLVASKARRDLVADPSLLALHESAAGRRLSAAKSAGELESFATRAAHPKSLTMLDDAPPADDVRTVASRPSSQATSRQSLSAGSTTPAPAPQQADLSAFVLLGLGSVAGWGVWRLRFAF